jgi:DNA-binding NarL/FixJ family response regulator
VDQEILLVGAETPALYYALPFLRRANFRITQVVRAADGLDLVRDSRFDLVVARHPLAGIELRDLVAAVRDEASACRRAGVLVLAEPTSAEEVGTLIGHGVNRVVSIDAHTEHLLEAIADLLSVKPRRTLRALVRLEAEVRLGGQVWQTTTHNISETGLLLRGMSDVEMGARLGFELALPQGDHAVSGEAEVVRRTDPEAEHVDGVGARILTFYNNSEHRLRIFLAEQPRSFDDD